MKLIICYTIGDGCSWHQNIILPIEYDSAEALICDFETTLNESKDKNIFRFKIGTYEFDVLDFMFEKPGQRPAKAKSVLEYEIILPEIYTLEEWFEKNNIYP